MPSQCHREMNTPTRSRMQNGGSLDRKENTFYFGLLYVSCLPCTSYNYVLTRLRIYISVFFWENLKIIAFPDSLTKVDKFQRCGFVISFDFNSCTIIYIYIRIDFVYMFDYSYIEREVWIIYRFTNSFWHKPDFYIQ